MRSNPSVGMPIDLLCYEPDSSRVQFHRRFDSGDVIDALRTAISRAHPYRDHGEQP